jgi:hypothetical protein
MVVLTDEGPTVDSRLCAAEGSDGDGPAADTQSPLVPTPAPTAPPPPY